MEIIIGLIAGAVGGNAAGSLLKSLSLGPIGNTLAGVLGGGAGAAILVQLGISPDPAQGAVQAGAFDVSGILAQAGAGGIAGAILTAIVGAVQRMMARSKR